MRYYVLIGFLLSLHFSCNPKSQRSVEKTVDIHSIIPDPDSVNREYDMLKLKINESQGKFIASFNSCSSDSCRKRIILEAENYLYNTLTKNLLPVWKGTSWDFNGISEQPLKGSIACGYYVSTTLKHCGFNLNRYKLAQLHAFEIIKKLNPYPLTFENRDAMLLHIQNLPNDLYVVGLDYHVGYILKSDDGIFMVHSSYYDPVQVNIENAADSQALVNSSVFVLGSMFSGGNLAEKWLKRARLIG